MARFLPLPVPVVASGRDVVGGRRGRGDCGAEDQLTKDGPKHGGLFFLTYMTSKHSMASQQEAQQQGKAPETTNASWALSTVLLLVLVLPKGR